MLGDDNLKKTGFLLIILLLFIPLLASAKNKSELTEQKFGGESYLIENYQQFKSHYKNLKRPTVGLALSGGGARAMVNFGVVKALREEGIPVDLLTGTSMGGIVATLYGSGLNTEQMLQIVTTTSFGNLIDLGLNGSGSLLDTKKLNYFMESVAPQKKLEDFEIPTALLSFELSAGKKYLTTTGQISEVIQSTYSIPYYFPVESRDDKYFMDAGIVEATPAKAAAALGADFVIATTSFADKDYSDLENAATSIDRFVNIMQENFSQQIIADYADFVIEIDVSDYNFMDFNQAQELVELGYLITKVRIPALKKKLTERGIELQKYHNRAINDVSQIMKDMADDRIIISGSESNWFLNYGQNKSYFDQDLITPFADQLNFGINAKHDNLFFSLKGERFFADGYETKLELKKLTAATDLYLAYGNDYQADKESDYRLELKYYGNQFKTGLGFGRQNDQHYYLISGDFVFATTNFNWQTENDFIYNRKESEIELLSSNIIDYDLSSKWNLASQIVYNNTEVLDSPIIYRGQSIDEFTQLQTSLDFKYTHTLLEPIELGGILQTTDVGGYLFTDYFETGKADLSGQDNDGIAAGIGFDSQLYLLGLRPVQVDLYFSYDFEEKDDKIGLELGYQF